MLMIESRVRPFLLYFLGTVILIFSVLFFTYHLAYARRIIPGVELWGVALGNKTREEAAETLRAKFSGAGDREFVLISGEERFSKALSEWGVILEATESARRAYLFGREGSIVKTTGEKFAAWFQGIIIAPAFRTAGEPWERSFGELSQVLNRPAKDAGFAIKDGALEITPASEGREVGEAELKHLFKQAILANDFSVREVPLRVVQPRLFIEDLSSQQERVSQIVFSSPQLTFGSRRWTLAPEEILALLEFSSDSSPVEVSLAEAAASSFVDRLAAEINRPARGGTFALESGRVIDFALPHAGYKLDEVGAKEALAAVILDAETTHAELPVVVQQPPAQAGNEYGIKSLLGTGTSNFKGSIAGRVHNVGLASSRLDGILIPPGETFSFNQSLGEVSSETGYQTSYIIKEGRTRLGVGGGVCQVSTTMFRAALYAGLPIVARTAHAYRVHYYEHPSGPGLDATVYEPAPDLQFKNDTPAHILIKRYFSSPTNTLKFEIYGTDDGRKTQVTGPVIHSQTRPPEPAYIEDADLPKGTTKQIDWAAWGAKVTVRRKVTRGGEVLQDDSFFSNYRPWQAVYLVGTKE